MKTNREYPGVKEYIRALRLPFLSVSIFPFITGSLIDRISFKFFPFLLGLVSVMFTHLGANLFNDYADSKSGADWQDRKFYKFFGGSKLIQEGIFSEKLYFNLAIFCCLIAFVCIFILTILLGNLLVVGVYFSVLFLGFSYSHKPFQLSYNGLGEAVIFLLFGPVLVMGGYFIQTQIFPDFKSFMLSLPFGFFTISILFANELPDFFTDLLVKKLNWVNLVGQKWAFLLYYFLVFLGFFSIILNILFGYLGPISYIIFLFLFLSIRAADILRRHYQNKTQLVESCKITIAVHSLVSLVLLLDMLL